MNSSVYMQSYAVACILSTLLASGGYSQNACECSEFFALKNQQKTEKDFKKNEATIKLKQAKNTGCIARYFEWEAELFFQAREYDSATVYLQRAMQVYKQSACTEENYLNYYLLNAQINQGKGDYPATLAFCYKLLPLTENLKGHFEEARCLLLISLTFNRMKESDKGIDYARRALRLSASITDQQDKADILAKAASSYLWYFQDTRNMHVLDSAEQLTREFLEIGRKMNNVVLLRKGYNILNGCAHERGNYPIALTYIDSGLATFSDKEDDLKATMYGDKADVLMELKKYTLARQYADSCLYLHKKAKNPETIANAFALIYQVSKLSENYKDALEAVESYVEIHDSLTNVQKAKQLNELEKKYNQAKNEKTIRELAQQKQIYLLLSVTGLLAAIAIGFFLRQQSLKHKQLILETEQRLNRSRMNPHFFFNTLASLQSFALQEGGGKSIASNISKFSHIMRETLESTYKEYVSVDQEAAFLEEYLSLQQVRFPQKFTYYIAVSDEIDTDGVLIPSMIIQPFVENSIEHGFAAIDYQGTIYISFKKVQNDLVIEVIDNGRGLALPGKQNNDHISRASQIIKDRIFLLNIKLKTKAGFSIDNNSESNGVIVKINLPLLSKGSVR